MNGPEVLRIVDAIHRDKKIDEEIVFEGIEQAILSAARKHYGEDSALIVSIDRKTRNIQLSIKAKDMADQGEAMAALSQSSARENAGTTSLGALLRAKLDNNN